MSNLQIWRILLVSSLFTDADCIKDVNLSINALVIKFWGFWLCIFHLLEFSWFSWCTWPVFSILSFAFPYEFLNRYWTMFAIFCPPFGWVIDYFNHEASVLPIFFWGLNLYTYPCRGYNISRIPPRSLQYVSIQQFKRLNSTHWFATISFVWLSCQIVSVILYHSFTSSTINSPPVTSSAYRFEETEAPGSRSFFTEIIASISDIKFARDGRHILSRDYMTLKVSAYIIAKILVHNFSLNLLQVFWIHIFIGVKVYYIKLAS
jgi:hypothetical protein